MQKDGALKVIIKYLILSILHYYYLGIEKLLLLIFYAVLIIKYKRLPNRLSTEQIEKLIKFTEEKRER